MPNDHALEPGQAFDRLGQITRQLHQAIGELGLDVHLHRIAVEIPDARDRLSYVGQMTERAAHKVLGLVESAKPECAQVAEHAQGAQRELDRLTVAEARRGLAEGQFPAGSMGPKIESAIQFIEGGGERCVITDFSGVEDALHGRGGTWITR